MPSRLITFVLFSLFALAPTLFAQPKHVRVWFLSGQSNMGAGGTPRTPVNNPPQPGDIWYRHSSPLEEPGSDQWTPLRDVISRGNESPFGEQMATAFPDDIIAIVKSARGGSGLGPFLPDGAYWSFINERITSVENDLNQRVASGEISGWSWQGYLWMQGETEAALAASSWPSEQYTRALTLLIAAMRERFGVADLPFVLGRIYAFGLHQAPEHESSWYNLRNVRHAQTTFPLQDARSAWLNTDDLPMVVTEPHYTSYEEMGHRFAHAFLNLHNNTHLPFRPAHVLHNPADYNRWISTPMAATPGANRVTLDWAHSIDATSYSIHYGTSPDNLNQSVTGITGNQVTISGLTNGTTYHFAARSHNAHGQSPLTATVSATPIPDAGGTPFVWTQDIKRTPFIWPDATRTPWAEEIELHQTLVLDGTVRDDSASVTPTWSMTSGPGTVTFANPSSIDTTATFSATGRYVLRLTATDGAHSAFHEIEVNVGPTVANAAPSVTIYTHPTINVLDSAALDALFLNLDRKPATGIYSFLWEKLSGPGSVTFSRPDHWLSDATFSAPGVYVLRLTGNDGDLPATDTLTVAVNPAGTRNWALNKPTAQSSGNMSLAVNGDVNEVNVVPTSLRFATNSEANPWGQVDLESSTQIDFLRLWNQPDANASRLSNYYVFVSPEPFASNDPAATITQLNANGGWHAFFSATAAWPEVIPVNHSGRYVRIQLAGTNNILQFKELEVIGPAGTEPPSGIAVTPLSASSLRIAWQDVSGESGFRLRRATDPAGPWTEIGGDLPGNVLAFTDTGLAELTRYYYQVQSFNAVAPSAWSEAATGVTLSALLNPELNAPSPTIAVANRAYSFDLDIIGGTPPYTVSLEGNVPPGLTIDAEGILSGTPTLGGTWNFAVRIEDDSSAVSTVPVTLVVAATNYAVSGGSVAVAQSSQFNTNTPQRAIDQLLTTWNHTAEQAEAWWQIDFGTARPLHVIEIHNRENSASRLTNFYILFSNTPFNDTDTLAQQLADPAVTALHVPDQALFPSAYPVPAGLPATRYVRVRQTSTKSYLHMVEFRAFGSLPPVLPSQTPPAANRLAPYSTRLSAHQGHGALVWSLAPGQSLPAGLTLAADGTLSGTPAVSGSFPVTFRVTDTLNQSADRTLTFTIQDTVANLWQSSFFTNPSTNPAATWDADPDGDGIKNLIEYALLQHPLEAEPASTYSQMDIVDNSPVFTFGPLRDDPNLDYIVEFSTDLITWESGPTTYSLRAIDHGDGTITLIATDQQSMVFLDRRFARLKVQFAAP